jgi:hypothetical protein
MNKSKQTIEESLKKIKFMMKYDSSMTRTEQKSIIDEQWAALGNVGSMSPQSAATFQQASPGTPQQLSPGKNMVNRKYVTDTINLIKQFVPYLKYLNNQTYGSYGENSIAYILDNNLTDDEKQSLLQITSSLGLISPSNIHEQTQITTTSHNIRKTTRLLKQLLDYWSFLGGKTYGFNTQSAQSYVLSQITPDERNTLNSMLPKSPAPDNKTATITQPDQKTATAGGGYKPVTGTEDDPYRFGTSGEGIKTMQGSLGLVQDGKFGPKTQAALTPLGIQTFTDQDIPNLQAKIQGKEVPQEAPQRDITQVKPKAAPIAQLNKAVPKFGTNPNINMPNMGTSSFNLAKPQPKTA